MICSVEKYKRNGCIPISSEFVFGAQGLFHSVNLKSGRFLRQVVHFNPVSLTANELKGK